MVIVTMPGGRRLTDRRSGLGPRRRPPGPQARHLVSPARCHSPARASSQAYAWAAGARAAIPLAWPAPMTSRMDRDFPAGWRDIDAAGDSARFADYLDAATAMLRERKRALLEALQLGAGDSAIDAGCGVGDDVVLLADRVGSGGHAGGVDLSASLLAEARGRTTQMGAATVVRD